MRVPLEQRFWAKVTKGGPDECWPWVGCLGADGYGKIAEGGVGGKTLRAPRVSWWFATGQMPPSELFVLHTCDNPPCVNPNHLFLGGHTENMEDCKQKKRQAFGDRHPMAKLTSRKVDAIRRSRAPAKSLAARFGVDEQSIRRVWRGATWKTPA